MSWLLAADRGMARRDFDRRSEWRHRQARASRILVSVATSFATTSGRRWASLRTRELGAPHSGGRRLGRLLPPRLLSAQMLPPERQHSLPRQFSCRPVVYLPLFVHKAVVGIVAENLGVLSRCPEARLKLAHRRGCAPIVPISEVSLQRDLDVCCL